MPNVVRLNPLQPIPRRSAVEEVFDELYARVLSVELPPGAKLSEAEVAKQFDVSRQTVRDAFFRLSQLGFLVIRPQRATTVSRISTHDIYKARFIRTAIELETVSRACRDLTDEDFDALDSLLTEQQAAVDVDNKPLFHALDDDFHKSICDRLGLGLVWDSIRENKAHTDRVRFLSLATGSQTALDDHREILAALRQRDAERAQLALRTHLGRIDAVVAQLQAENHEWFVQEGH